MDQQRSALMKHIIKCFSCLPSSLTDVLSINRHWSILINDCLRDASTNRHLDVPSTHQYLAQNFNRPTPIALLRFCNSRTKVWNVKKSQVGRYNWSLASRDKVAWWLCVHGALGHCTFKT